MRSQKQLRDELRFVNEFNTLFDVVQQTAVTQTRHLEERAGAMRLLTEAIKRDFLALLPQAAAQHAFMRGGDKGRLLVVITSDEGLVGPLHANIVEEASRRVVEPTTWLFLGQRGLRMIGGQPMAEPAQVIAMPPDERTDEQLLRVRQFIIRQYQARQLKDVWVIAPKYVSMTHQEIFIQQLLPLPVDKGRNSDERLVLEPALDPVIERLTQVWIETVLRDCYWSARRAEYSARAMHVEAARQELARQNLRVRHEFFKAQHERVDVMVRETCVVQRQIAGIKRRQVKAGVPR